MDELSCVLGLVAYAKDSAKFFLVAVCRFSMFIFFLVQLKSKSLQQEVGIYFGRVKNAKVFH